MGVPVAQANMSVTADDHDDREMLHTSLRRAIRAASRAARWYEDEDVMPGDWIRFSGDFGYSILDSASFRLFLMTQTAATLHWETALLLFGNPGNAQVGKPPAPVNVSELDSYVANLITFARDLLDAEETEAATAGSSEHNRSATQLFARIAAARHGTEHVEGLAKATEVIEGTGVRDCAGHEGALVVPSTSGILIGKPRVPPRRRIQPNQNGRDPQVKGGPTDQKQPIVRCAATP
jgi:hypothetical protein